jgi:hypothetical protein
MNDFLWHDTGADFYKNWFGAEKLGIQTQVDIMPCSSLEIH